MAGDATTFFWGFAAIFGALGWYLWHLERKVDDMRRRLDALAPRPLQQAPHSPAAGRGAEEPRRRVAGARREAVHRASRDGTAATQKGDEPEAGP